MRRHTSSSTSIFLRVSAARDSKTCWHRAQVVKARLPENSSRTSSISLSSILRLSVSFCSVFISLDRVLIFLWGDSCWKWTYIFGNKPQFHAQIWTKYELFSCTKKFLFKSHDSANQRPVIIKVAYLSFSADTSVRARSLSCSLLLSSNCGKEAT